MGLHLLPERIREKITVEGECWVWTACVVGGYGQVQVKGQRFYSHRLVYETLVGPIPDGLQLDHLVDRCTTKLCCNPDHLEPVTGTENMRRYFATITECPQGHPYDDENTYIDKRGCRTCKVCKADADRARRAAGYVRPSRRKVTA